MKKWRLAHRLFALAGLLLGIGFGAFCGEDNPPENPALVTKPAGDKTEVPETDTSATHQATFSDYAPLTSLFSATPAIPANPAIKPSYPIVENKYSSVANQLVRDTSNEGLFLSGASPQTPTIAAPASDATLLHTGQFVFHTQLAVDNFLNDNYLGSASNRRGSWLQNDNPSFTMNYTPNERASIDAFYSFTYHDYTTNVEKDYYDESGGVSIKLRHFGIEGLSFSISDLYNQIGDTIINPLSNQFDINNLEFRTGTRYATNSLPVSFAYALGPLSLEAVYAYDITDYFSQDFNSNDVQQHTWTLRGAWTVTPEHFAVFGETSFNYSRYPSAGKTDFDFANMFVGVRGVFQSLTYQVRTGYSILDTLGNGTTVSRPLLAADVKYVLSPKLDFSAFGNRSLSDGALTGEQKTDSYGAVANVHPMQHGVVSLGYVFQSTMRPHGTDEVRTSELSYHHTILGWLDPRLGMKYSLESVASEPHDTIWTGSGGIGFKVTDRGRADVDYYHEIRFGDVNGKRITDRVTTGYSQVLNRFSSATFGFDHAQRRESFVRGSIRIEELRLGIKMNW